MSPGPRHEPTRHLDRVFAQGARRVGHLNTERAINRLVADAKAEDEPSVGRIGDQHRCLGADIRKPQIDIGDRAADT